jgi:hypothetical protein
LCGGKYNTRHGERGKAARKARKAASAEEAERLLAGGGEGSGGFNEQEAHRKSPYNMIIMLMLLLLFGAFYMHGSYASISKFGQSANVKNVYLPPTTTVLETKLITTKELKEKYTDDINSEIHFDNWYLGCSDLAGLAPYIRIVMDRLFRGDGKRHLIFDVGANNGQDASTIMGIFQPVIGMCEGMLSNNVKVISVEPSPKVFCELEDLVKERKWTDSQILRLNIGLSDTSGVFQFADPGHEGGSLNTNSKVTHEGGG